MSMTRTSGILGVAFASRRATSLGALILACAVVGTCPMTLTATTFRRDLTVRVYQSAALSPTMRNLALAAAEKVLRSGHVDVHWQDCTDPRSSDCDGPPGPAELVLVLRDGATCQRRWTTLGQALVIPGGSGVVASVNLTCVASLARVARRDITVLLGRVAAHELGHLLMRSSAHAYRGLMRANWTPDEVRRNRATDWEFTAHDIAAMREGETVRAGVDPQTVLH